MVVPAVLVEAAVRVLADLAVEASVVPVAEVLAGVIAVAMAAGMAGIVAATDMDSAAVTDTAVMVSAFGFGLGYGLGYGYGYPYYGYGYGAYGYPAYGYGVGYDAYPDYGYSSYAAAPAYSQSAQQTPAVVNQYYSTPASTTQSSGYFQGRVRQDPPPGSSQGIGTLIAFPDGSVQIAVAYWVEGGTLHYVTRDKAQKQVALTAIDRGMTDQLNRERGMEFRP